MSVLLNCDCYVTLARHGDKAFAEYGTFRAGGGQSTFASALFLLFLSPKFCDYNLLQCHPLKYRRGVFTSDSLVPSIWNFCRLRRNNCRSC